MVYTLSDSLSPMNEEDFHVALGEADSPQERKKIFRRQFGRAEFYYEEVECLACGNVGLMSSKRCRACLTQHQIEI